MLQGFELERYLLKHESKASLSLCGSGLETVGLSELLAMADAECRALWEKLSLEYSPPQGLSLLKTEISRQYASVRPEQICVFAGAAEAIFCILQGLLDPGDHAVVVTPCYQSLESVPASRCRVSRVALEEESGWRLNLEKLEAALEPNTKVIIVNFPNNPTGAIPDRETFSALIDLARKRNLYLFSDEVYRLMEVDPAERLPAMADRYERGISVSSMSKPYGLPGLRIGWAACGAPEVIQAAIDIKHYTSICANATSEILAMMALRAQEGILDRNMTLMRRNLEQMNRFFENHPDSFRWVPPRGGCLGFPRLLTEETADSFALRLLDEMKVLILPGSLYGWPSRHVRISCGRAGMPEALAKFEQFISASALSKVEEVGALS